MYYEYLPIKVKQANKTVIWYMDISKLGLSDLLNLRKELTKTDSYAVQKIDSIMYEEIGHINGTIHSRNRENKKAKELTRIKKKISKRNHKTRKLK